MKNRKILEKMIYLAIFFIPLYLVKIKIGFLPTNVLEIMIVGIFLLWFFSGKEKIKFRNFFIKYKNYVIFGGIMLLGILLSTFFSGNQLQSWGIIKGWFLMPLILFFLTWNIIEKEKINNIFLSYFFSAGCVAIIALGYYILGYVTFDGRLSGIFNSPNYLAMYLAPASIVFIFQEKINKIRMIAPAGIILVVLYLTYSYSAWMSIFISAMIVFFWKNIIEKNKISWFQVGGIMLILFFLILSQGQKDKFRNLINAEKRSSLSSRVMIWKASQKMIENNFVFGIGPGNFQKTYLEYQKFFPPYLEWAVPHPNNLYLAWWLSGGIFGLVGFLGLVFFFSRDVFGRLKKEPNDALFMVLGIMLVILIHGIFDTTYFKNDLAIVFWLNFLALKL